MEAYKHGMSEIPSTHFCLEFILNKVKLPIKEIRERLSKTAESLCGQIRSLYPGREVELYSGGQKYRHYIISVE